MLYNDRGDGAVVSSFRVSCGISIKPVDAVPCSLPDLRRVDFDVLAVGTHGFALLVSSQGLPHVESVGAIGVVVYYSSVDGVSDARG